MASTAGQEAKALELMEKADKKYKSMWPGNTKYEEAEEMYVKAANLFKVCKKWQEAGDAFSKAADCQHKLGSQHEVAQHYVSAAGSYQKVSVSEAIRCLRLAVEIYVDMGRFSIAAKNQKEIAELYEAEADLEEAINAYELASQYYAGENSSSSANACLLKVALFSGQLERYRRAIEIFEEVGTSSVDNNLLKWNVKDHFLNAGLCHLCTGEIHTVRRAIERYTEIDMTFSSTREYTFLVALTDAVEGEDMDAFMTAVSEFDQITKLNNWKTIILLVIKNKLKAEDSDEDR